MSRSLRHMIGALLTLVCAACVPHVGAEDCQLRKKGDKCTLKLLAPTRIAQNGQTHQVVFTNLYKDSRCPSDVMCIHGGIVTLSVTVDGTPRPMMFKGEFLPIPGLDSVGVTRVDPYPVATRTEKPNYSITLERH